MTTPPPTPPAVRTPGTVRFREFVAFISLYGGPETRVRFRATRRGSNWTCDTCGRFRTATCPHQRAALAARINEWNTHGHL